ncbi:small ribosomal subunit protein mS40 isoform X2 [Rhineura floridana]|uniref:small ribosomal subunit protein mS40 isoform X2 n=1 Tax=Rhineura floridana TaxID=261503 RepID=UPI002AC86994|nr:small ribosomal subunit protein mS40 isoform X2 [Rhineura floridana]
MRLAWTLKAGTQSISSISFLQPERFPFRLYSTEASQAGPTEPVDFDRKLRFKEKPWEYLESEEYIERYGNKPIWFGYRRNHKGQIPPQKTRRTCIRGSKVCGNPCPICRDPNLFVDYRNVKLLEQFICPHMGITYHPTHTGVCMRKYKHLTEAIEKARNSGLLSSYIPFTTFHEDFSNQHPAVTKTAPSPALQNKAAWYEWYEWQQPPEKEIQRIRRIYKDYLKEESGPP